MSNFLALICVLLFKKCHIVFIGHGKPCIYFCIHQCIFNIIIYILITQIITHTTHVIWVINIYNEYFALFNIIQTLKTLLLAFNCPFVMCKWCVCVCVSVSLIVIGSLNAEGADLTHRPRTDHHISSVNTHTHTHIWEAVCVSGHINISFFLPAFLPVFHLHTHESN